MRTLTRWPRVGLAVLGGALLVAPWSLSPLVREATAQGAPVSQERLEQSRRAMEEGQGLYGQKKYAEAAQAFQRAYAAQPFAAFLFNEAVCHEKLGDVDRAIDTFRRYLAADPSSPDAEAVRGRIKRLEAGKAAAGDAGAADPDGGAPPPPPVVDTTPEVIRSLVLVESDPPGAPVAVWQKIDPGAAAFRPELENKGWKEVMTGTAPAAVTLMPGKFHVVVDKWRTYNRSETNIEVLPGHVHHFKANLSQGAFMAFLRVSSNVKGATVFLDDPPPHENPPWGPVPRGELLAAGEHTIWVEAPGYEPFTKKLDLTAGDQVEVLAELERVSYGYLLVDGNAPKITVTVDGQPRGVFEAGGQPLKLKEKAGKHRVVAEADGKKTFDDEIEVPLGQSREVHVVFVNKYGRGAAWAAAIAGAAFLGGGAFFGVQSNKARDDMQADRRAGRLAPDDTRGDKGKAFAYVADGCFVVGGALAVLATYEFIRDPLPPSGANLDDPRDFEAPAPRKKKASLFEPRIRDLGFAPSPAGGGGFFVTGAF